MIKYFRNDTFGEKNITKTEVVFIKWLSYNVVSKQKKNENTECYCIFIPFKSHVNSKQGSLIFLLFRSWSLVRSSHPEVSHNLQENTCARVSFFNKVAGLRPRVYTFIKIRLWHRYFHVKFAKFLRIPLVAASV